jgi:hypothetical protein
VGIYCTADGRYKVFDSHARDSLGMADPQGTCILLEVQTISELKGFFYTLYDNRNDVLFELKGVHIAETQTETTASCNERQGTEQNMTSQTNVNIENTCNLPAVISFYCICFSIIKSCSYWNSQTLDAIIDHGNVFYREMLKADKDLAIKDFPNRLQIYDADIHVVFSLQSQGILCNTLVSKLYLQKLILDNKNENTGFLLWDSSFCVSCIFQHNLKSKITKYYVIAFNKTGKVDVFQDFYDADFLVQTLCNLVTKEFKCDEIEYCIKFLSCSSQLSNTVRQKVMRKHKSTAHKKLIANREKHNYSEMPITKRYLEFLFLYYKSHMALGDLRSP